jgi:hypothetical protein
MAVADRLLNLPTVRRSDALRTFVTATWLGWQIESNWANPGLFAAYAIARPLSPAAPCLAKVPWLSTHLPGGQMKPCLPSSA